MVPAASLTCQGAVGSALKVSCSLAALPAPKLMSLMKTSSGSDLGEMASGIKQENMQLSDHWSIYLSIVYTDGHQLFRVQEGVSHS